MIRLIRYFILLVIASLMLSVGVVIASPPPAPNPQNGAIGVNGRINSAAPTQAPTITTPTDGASVSNLPINVAGLCSSNFLIEVFKNDVFSGSTLCKNGSYSLQTDLFTGKNDLVARAYDALNQSSPDSNKVSVTFNDQIAASGTPVSLISAYAKRGADPGTELSWPLTIEGGTEPYAVSVDWGDGSDAELLSQKTAGDFNINHIYKVAGTYNVTIKATDDKGEAAFLQVVAIGNGTIEQSSGSSTAGAGTSGNSTSGGLSADQTKQAVIVTTATLSGMAAASFWLGRMHSLASLRRVGGKKPF